MTSENKIKWTPKNRNKTKCRIQNKRERCNRSFLRGRWYAQCAPSSSSRLCLWLLSCWFAK